MPDFSPSALRAARERAGLTQHELARLVGVSGGERVSLWERGVMAPRAGTVRVLAEVLTVPVEELLGVDPGSADLRGLRRRVALSTAEIAESAFVSTSTYERWERGVGGHTPAEEAIQGMAARLQVDRSTVQRAVELSAKKAAKR